MEISNIAGETKIDKKKTSTYLCILPILWMPNMGEYSKTLLNSLNMSGSMQRSILRYSKTDPKRSNLDENHKTINGEKNSKNGNVTSTTGPLVYAQKSNAGDNGKDG